MTTSGLTTIGEVSVTSGEFVVKWKIKEFSSLSSKTDVNYISPTFVFAGESWSLQIFPNGQSEHLFDDPMEKSEGSIDLFLWRESSGAPISLDYSLGLETLDGIIDLESLFSDTFKKNDGYGAVKLLSRAELLLQRKYDLIPLDTLTVVCKIKYSNSTEAVNKRNKKLVNDLKTLMLSGIHSDATVKVKGVEFRLHRNILASRSPFFCSMFNSNMKESITGIVSIDDCEPHLFRTFIHFLYTGEVDEMTLENVCDLYELSDKYREDQLKEECLQFMGSEISIDSFCNFILLALKHSERELLDNAVKFFASKVKEIIRSVKWQTFLAEYPMQANELLIKALDYSQDQ